MAKHRIVSLIASATEIVAALGMEDQLVGRSHECDYPLSVLNLPMCSKPRIDVNGTSREIDDRVKSVLKNAISVYEVFTEELERLAPSVIITQTQCEVCAVSLKDVQAAVCDLVRSNPKIVALEPMALADVWRDITAVAEALDVPHRGAGIDRGTQRSAIGNSSCRNNTFHAASDSLLGMDRPVDVRRKLGARTCGTCGRRKLIRHRGRAFALDDLGGTYPE